MLQCVSLFDILSAYISSSIYAVCHCLTFCLHTFLAVYMLQYVSLFDILSAYISSSIYAVCHCLTFCLHTFLAVYMLCVIV